MFDVDTLIAECRTAVGEGEPHRAVREVLERTVAGAGATAVGDTLQPKAGGLEPLYLSEDLTVLHVVWAPGMRLFPHDHRMWAAIAIYAGQEDNTFYRRADDDRTTVTESGGKELEVGDVLLLGKDAIHVYGGDFVSKERSQWGPGPLVERPYEYEVVRKQFAEANERAGLTA